MSVTRIADDRALGTNGSRDDVAVAHQIDSDYLMHWKEDPFAMNGIDIVQQVVACVIQDHTNGTERDAGGSELKRHLDDRALLVQVFERS